MQDKHATTRLRLLLLEDDQELADLLAALLQEQGFEVRVATTVSQASRLIDQTPPDLAVLDVQLPDGSGFGIASQLRRNSPATGVVMLTRLTDPSWQVAGFDVGADVYLPKPVHPDVLVAAVRRLATRQAGVRAPAVVARWSLVEDGWRLQAPDGRSIALGAAERDVLRLLVAQAPERVARERLLAVMGEADAQAGGHRLDMLVHRLRRKIEAAGLAPLPLRVVRGFGYALVQEEASSASVASSDAIARELHPDGGGG